MIPCSSPTPGSRFLIGIMGLAAFAIAPVPASSAAAKSLP